MKECPRCHTKHDKNGIYCSRSCANVRIHSDETKKKISNSIIQYRLKNPEIVKEQQIKNGIGIVGIHIDKPIKPDIENKCQECSTIFKTRPYSMRKYCSSECRIKNLGGYRNGSGRAKTGYYKGIYCGSTYELAWIIYQIDHNISFTRFDGYLENDKIKYFPDFLVEGKIVEIKGYHTNEVDMKTELAIESGYDIEVLYKDDLKEIFSYVETKYETTNFSVLYDNYKPKYTYICSNCDISYNSQRIKKTDITYCSRKCAMIGNHRHIK